MSPDQIRYVQCFVVAYVVGLVLPEIPSKKGRMWGATMVGVCFLVYANGVWGSGVFVGIVALGYVLLTTLPQHSVGVGMLTAMAAIMAGVHVHRMVSDPYGWTMDYSGAVMIGVVKMTSLGFDVASAKIPHPPSLPHYLGYMLFFPAVLAGPVFSYTAYTSALRGGAAANSSLAQRLKDRLWQGGVWGIGRAAACGAVYMALTTLFPPSAMYGDLYGKQEEGAMSWESWPLVARLVFLYLAQTGLRFRYYVAFALTEGACLVSGMEGGMKGKGFEYNIDINAIETAQNFRQAVGSWNIGVANWLKHYVYKRIPSESPFWRILGTNIVGAIWHGFYPGYYASFILGSLYTQLSRLLRRHLRPLAVDAGPPVKLVYDAAGWVGTALVLAFGSVPFTVLRWDVTAHVWAGVGWFGIWLLVVGYVFVWGLSVVVVRQRKSQ